MTVLSRQGIARAYATSYRSHEPMIDPWRPETHLQPASYDVSLHESLLLWPGRFVLASTQEWVMIPRDLVAQLAGRSSLGRKGVAIHVTAGYIDPGFCGTITLEIVNHQPWYTLFWPPAWVKIPAGTRVGQLSFSCLDEPTVQPYHGRYQGQIGPIESRLNEPTEGVAS